VIVLYIYANEKLQLGYTQPSTDPHAGCGLDIAGISCEHEPMKTWLPFLEIVKGHKDGGK